MPNAGLSFICSYDGCSARFSRRYRLEIHMRMHTGERPYVCSHEGCAKSYVRSQHLKRHLATHAGVELKCEHPGCSSSFKTAENLRKHVKNKHAANHTKIFKCGYCSEEFKKRSDKTVHESVHTNTRPHVCPREGCNKSFLMPSKLKRHLKVHEGHKCNRPNCGVVCPTWTLFLEHQKTFHPTVYQCPLCSKTFSKAFNLAMHRTVHLDPSEREQYPCPWNGCSRIYSQERNLKYHIKKFHEGSPCQDKQQKPRNKKCKKKLKKKKLFKQSFAAFLAGFKDVEQAESHSAENKSEKVLSEGVVCSEENGVLDQADYSCSTQEDSEPLLPLCQGSLHDVNKEVTDVTDSAGRQCTEDEVINYQIKHLPHINHCLNEAVSKSQSDLYANNLFHEVQV